MSIEETLAARLHDVTPTPPREVSVDDVARRVQSMSKPEPVYRQRWVAALTAAAVVGAVAATVVVLRDHGSQDRVPPARPTSTVTRSVPTPSVTKPVPTPTPTPSVVNGFHAASCPASELDPFASALKPVPTTVTGGGYDLAGLPILSITSDGDVLAGTSGDATIPARLDLIRPDGTRSTLYRASDVPLAGNDTVNVASAQGDARWIVFAVAVGPPGQKDLRRLGVVNRTTGTVTTYRTLPANSATIMLPPVLYQGRAYWSEVDSGGTGSVFSLDPSTGSTVTVDTGTGLGTPTMIGGGLYWQHDGHVRAYRPGTLPAGFPPSTAKFPPMASDGKNTVWATTADTNGQTSVELVLSTPDMTTPLVLTHSSTANILVPLAVGGSYVIWDDGQKLVALDTRTGATATVGDSTPGFSTIAIRAGTIAVNQTGSKGGAQLSISRLASLPKLTC